MDCWYAWGSHRVGGSQSSGQAPNAARAKQEREQGDSLASKRVD